MSISPKVLVVDDQEPARRAVSDALESEGYRLEEAADASGALDSIERFRPDVVVYDLTLDDLDGILLVIRLAQEPFPPPVIVTAEPGQEELAFEALRLGAYDVLRKPFGVADLRMMVRHALEKQGLADRLKQSQAALLQAEKISSLGRLAAGITHEINTPLGVLKSSTDTIERASHRLLEWAETRSCETAGEVEWLVELLADTASQSHAACERINNIVTNLRNFAQLDRADFRPASVRDGIETTISMVRHELQPRTRVETDFAVLPEIECSPRQLNQLFMNLLLNANEAIRQNGGQGLIRVATRLEGGLVVIEVEDNGVGIPAENLDRIFDPGFTTKRGLDVGSGLGLPICCRIVKDHGGKIEVESRPGQGSRFTVRLPVRREG